MIPRSEPSWQVPWQQELQQLITTPEALFDYLGLDPNRLDEARAAALLFPLRVTRPYAARITPGDFNDPLLQQVLPLGRELHSPPEYTSDPLSEAQANPVAGIVHKYKSRVLLIAATQCAINCRYCFRRDFPYADNRLSKAQWHNALAYIRNQRDVNEVILSGGDPLALGDQQLEWLATTLAQMDHISRIRIHTRLPVVLPGRVTDALCQLLTATRLQAIVVVHSNHANEIDSDVQAGFGRLREAGVHLLNQTVLLRGVNDCVSTLVNLSERLFAANVLPYYLHRLDKVKGASHFAVSEDCAKTIYRELLAELPGFLVPKFVTEIPQKASKILVNPY